MQFEGLRPAYGYAGLEPEFCDYKSSKYVFLPVPYDSTTSYRVGTREGPAAIIAASMNMELYDIETASNPFEAGICTLPGLEPDMSSPEKTVKKLQKIAGAILKDGKMPIAVGGEHSISYGPIAAYAKVFNAAGHKMAVLQIDAHSDLRSEFEGTIYNHASVMRRVRDDLKLHTVHVGIRSYCDEEAEYIKKRKVPVFHGSEVSGKLVEKIPAILKSLEGYENLYITIDIDGFDPSIVPGTGTPEPGGIFWYETLSLLKELTARKNVVGFDLVELMPIPGNHASDFLAAKLIYKIIAYMEKYGKKNTRSR